MAPGPLDLEGDKTLWARYAEGTAGREPMKFLDVAMEKTDGHRGEGRLVVDLGCGAGNEALAFLESGWRVIAVDKEQRAIEILESRVPSRLRARLETQLTTFTGIDVTEADLVFASLSLPFAAGELRPSVATAISALKPGGWFVAVFLGPNDEWAHDAIVEVVEPADLQTMLSGLDDLEVTEEEFDGPSGAGKKHWHWLIASGRRRRG